VHIKVIKVVAISRKKLYNIGKRGVFGDSKSKDKNEFSEFLIHNGPKVDNMLTKCLHPKNTPCNHRHEPHTPKKQIFPPKPKKINSNLRAPNAPKRTTATQQQKVPNTSASVNRAQNAPQSNNFDYKKRPLAANKTPTRRGGERET
jgi:hypothetical protein